MKTIAIFISAYLAIVLLMYFMQSKLLFYPSGFQSSPALLNHFNDAAVTIDNGEVSLHGWVLNPDRQKLLIYYGGNAEEVSGNLVDFNEAFSDYCIVLINYRGYGNSGGSPSQQALFSDALLVLDHLQENAEVQYEEVVLIGRSLGSGVACFVAANRPVNKLILITPYDSIREVAKKHYPWLPVGFLLRHPFPSTDFVEQISVPVLILQAEYDQVVPSENTEKLIEAFGDKCRAIEIENSYHNTIQNYREYWDSIEKFMSDDL